VTFLAITCGMRFGNLIALKPHPFSVGVSWSCWCDCGALTHVHAQALRNGSKTNCGGRKHWKRRPQLISKPMELVA
jgi:hypothetical protein